LMVAQNLQEVHDQFQRAEAARRAEVTASRGAGATGGAEETSQKAHVGISTEE
jgi:hypothetical protein